MAKDEEEQEEVPEEKKHWQLIHNLDDPKIIVLRRIIQKGLYNRPDEDDRISMSMVNKKEDVGIFFEATENQAASILAEFEKIAGERNRWGGSLNPNFQLQEIDAPPNGAITAEQLEELEEQLVAGLRVENNQLYTRLGAMTQELIQAQETASGLEAKCVELAGDVQNEKNARQKLAEEIGKINTVYDVLAKGSLTEAGMELLKARNDVVETIEMMLAELREAGFDTDFITKPPTSADRYAQERAMKEFDIDYQELQSALDLGTAETWEKCKIYASDEEIETARKKLEALNTLIESADDSVKDIVSKGMQEHIAGFSKALRVYESKVENWKKAREIYQAFQQLKASGQEDIAKAKGLQGALADVKQSKFPVYAVPEGDSATLYVLSNTGIAFESLKTAIEQHAKIVSEDTQGGLTVLKLGCKNGDWKPTDCLLAVRDSYNTETDAGKIGNKLGLIVQF
ncbi:hypothetical protein KY310_02510 [Candidatus Woesearchaeota archaeon]|nr:hypothetical protein [Candidatus Woesearchaeota archaeon]